MFGKSAARILKLQVWVLNAGECPIASAHVATSAVLSAVLRRLLICAVSRTDGMRWSPSRVRDVRTPSLRNYRRVGLWSLILRLSRTFCSITRRKWIQMRQRICPQPGGHARSGEGTFKRSFTAEMMEIVVLPHRRLQLLLLTLVASLTNILMVDIAHPPRKALTGTHLPILSRLV